MRKTIALLFFGIIAALLIPSCSKGPDGSFCGDYSFKMGGYVKVKSDFSDKTSIRYLATRVGRMQILPASGDEVKVTLNAITGNPVVFDGFVNGGILVLRPQDMIVRLYKDILLLDIPEEALLTVSGTGSMIDGTLLIDFDLQGFCPTDIFYGEIVSSNVDCIAVRNE